MSSITKQIYPPKQPYKPTIIYASIPEKKIDESYINELNIAVAEGDINKIKSTQVNYSLKNSDNDNVINIILNNNRNLSEDNKLDLIKFFINSRVSQYDFNKNNQTAIMLACKYQYTKIVKYLVSIDSDITKQDSSKRSVFHYASIGFNVSCDIYDKNDKAGYITNKNNNKEKNIEDSIFNLELKTKKERENIENILKDTSSIIINILKTENFKPYLENIKSNINNIQYTREQQELLDSNKNSDPTIINSSIVKLNQEITGSLERSLKRLDINTKNDLDKWGFSNTYLKFGILPGGTEDPEEILYSIGTGELSLNEYLYILKYWLIQNIINVFYDNDNNITTDLNLTDIALFDKAIIESEYHIDPPFVTDQELIDSINKNKISLQENIAYDKNNYLIIVAKLADNILVNYIKFCINTAVYNSFNIEPYGDPKIISSNFYSLDRSFSIDFSNLLQDILDMFYNDKNNKSNPVNTLLYSSITIQPKVNSFKENYIHELYDFTNNSLDSNLVKRCIKIDPEIIDILASSRRFSYTTINSLDMDRFPAIKYSIDIVHPELIHKLIKNGAVVNKLSLFNSINYFVNSYKSFLNIQKINYSSQDLSKILYIDNILPELIIISNQTLISKNINSLNNNILKKYNITLNNSKLVNINVPYTKLLDYDDDLIVLNKELSNLNKDNKDKIDSILLYIKNKKSTPNNNYNITKYDLNKSIIDNYEDIYNSISPTAIPAIPYYSSSMYNKLWDYIIKNNNSSNFNNFNILDILTFLNIIKQNLLDSLDNKSNKSLQDTLETVNMISNIYKNLDLSVLKAEKIPIIKHITKHILSNSLYLTIKRTIGEYYVRSYNDIDIQFLDSILEYNNNTLKTYIYEDLVNSYVNLKTEKDSTVPDTVFNNITDILLSNPNLNGTSTSPLIVSIKDDILVYYKKVYDDIVPKMVNLIENYSKYIEMDIKYLMSFEQLLRGGILENEHIIS